MASRKKPDNQTSLFAAPAPIKVVPSRAVERDEALLVSSKGAVAITNLGEDDAPERPKMRLVHSQPEEDVIVEAQDDGRFEVMLLKAHGGTRMSILYTRTQLEMLVRRAQGALKVT